MRKLTFSAEIVELFQRNQLVAEYDMSVKNSVIGVVQIIMIRSKRVVMEKEIFLKDQSLNNTRSAEVIMLLDFIKILSKKSFKMGSQTIIILINNNKVQQMVHNNIKVVNHFNQEAASEISRIRRLIQQILIQI